MIDERDSILRYVEAMAVRHDKVNSPLPSIATAVTLRALASDIAAGLDVAVFPVAEASE